MIQTVYLVGGALISPVQRLPDKRFFLSLRRGKMTVKERVYSTSAECPGTSAKCPGLKYRQKGRLLNEYYTV